MKTWVYWLAGTLLVGLIVGPPIAYFRLNYDHQKRLRAVSPGHFYRSGQLTADGFEEAVKRLGIRTVINVQGEFPDPMMETNFCSRRKVSEKTLCDELGVRYVYFNADELRSDRNNPEAVPNMVADYLKVLDDPNVYPVLLHCRAGLHRTGVLTAVYRMEYEGWSHAMAADELKAHGFDVVIGRRDCTAANDYVKQYVLNYRPRDKQKQKVEAHGSQANEPVQGTSEP